MGASPWSDHLRRGWSKTSSVNGLEVAVACWSCQTLRLLRISSRMAIRHQEHRQFGAECSGVDDLGLEMEATCTGCALVDIRGGSDDYMLHTVDYDWAVAYRERPRSVLSPSRVRPEFDWSPDDWRDSCMATSTNNGQMTVERRKAETIGELDTHLGYMMAELGAVSQELKEMREHFRTMVALLATKDELVREVTALRTEMARQSPKNIWATVVWICAGISAISGAVFVIAELVRYLKP